MTSRWLRSRMASSAGVTLTEMLVSLLILVILIALALPLLSRLAEQGRQAGCLQNIRTFGAGCMALITDAKGLPFWDGQPGAQVEGSTYPDFYQWLVDGGYIPGNRSFRCPKATSQDRARTFGMQYAGNSGLAIHFNRNPLSIPFPHARVVLAAESYSGNFNIAGHLNRTLWANDSSDVGPGVEGTATGWPTPQFHGSREQRGLNLFFLDGHATLVKPVDNDWRNEPVYGANGNGGYIYDRDQLRRIKNGSLRP